MGPPGPTSTVILFDAEGRSPVAAQEFFAGTLQSAAADAHSLELNVEVPLLPAVLGGPYISVSNFNSSIGPRGLRYVERIRHHRITYVPTGLTVPPTCRPPGFVFAATFGFADGSQTTAKSIVPCPRERRRRRRPMRAKHAARAGRYQQPAAHRAARGVKARRSSPTPCCAAQPAAHTAVDYTSWGMPPLRLTAESLADSLARPARAGTSQLARGGRGETQTKPGGVPSRGVP